MNETEEIVGSVTELLQAMIRNRCVNDGSLQSGHEARNARELSAILRVPGVDVEVFEALPDRSSVVARIEGRNPTAPTLLLLGHTDVVPASADGWSRDPFGGELVDGFVWGRGAIDMLNLTASMAVAVRRLALTGFRPEGTLIFAGVADEEAGGTYGTDWLLKSRPGTIDADNVVTEWGGAIVDTDGGPRLWVTVGEKGLCWIRLLIRGIPGHGSRPLRADNAIVKAAEVVHRIARFRPAPVVDAGWRLFVEGMTFPSGDRAALLDPSQIWTVIDRLPQYMAQRVHASTHLTVAPTVIRGGAKTNIIPDSVEIELDCRMLPGQSLMDVESFLNDALGDLRSEVEVVVIKESNGTVSSTQTRLWDCLTEVASSLCVGAQCVPALTTGSTDARYFRERGIPAYGFGMFSRLLSVEDIGAMFHGLNERVDQESLRLSTELWIGLARQLLLP